MYTVPIIPPDLRHEETIIQAAHALDCLQKTINSVFGRLDERINKNNAKVQELGERITTAQAKIKGLIGTKKAIKIYAPARFPATQVYRDIPQTFTATLEQQPPLHTYEVQTRLETAPSEKQALTEKLVFFHVRSKQTQPTVAVVAAKMQTNQRQGMGSVPENLRSVTSLLRFNTDEQVYGVDSADSDTNTWKRAKQLKHQRQQQHNRNQAQKQLLEPAPYSLAQAHRNQKLTPSGGLRYTPKLNEAPEINLPLDLPDLPGIADDIHFEGKEDQQQIAPSLFVENLPDLPELEEEQAKKKIAQTQATPKSMANIPHRVEPAPKLSTTVMVQPPPPPPPPPLAAAPPAPPPPPPPPLAIKSNTAVVSNKPNSTQVTSGSDSSNTRSALMDAIRQAGGTQGGRLRAAAAAPVDVVDNNNRSSNSAKPAGGDLMADLHNKLLMRRKGISGAKENPNTTAKPPATSSNPVISRLSALIPPPSARRNQQQTQSDDEGDEDTDWAD